MRRSGLILIAALLSLICLAACGGQSSAQAAISQTMKTWGSDFAQYKDKAACALMSAAEQSDLVKTGKKVKILSCAAVLRFDAEGLTAAERKQLEHGSVSNIQVTGSTATAVFDAGTAKLTKVGGRWVIAGGLGG